MPAAHTVLVLPDSRPAEEEAEGDGSRESTAPSGRLPCASSTISNSTTKGDPCFLSWSRVFQSQDAFDVAQLEWGMANQASPEDQTLPQIPLLGGPGQIPRRL